jgi:hexosaminidase
MEKWPLKVSERTRGVYTQNDIRDLVRYASSRNVTLVPEIEFPAHSSIVMAAYPKLMCPNNPLRTGEQSWGPKSYEWAEYCPASEKTCKFIDTVLGEVIDLFPSAEIHVGGDEYFGLAWKKCPDCQERIRQANIGDEDTEQLRSLFAKCTGDRSKYLLYRHMMRRVCAMVVAKGRHPMLWDDLSWRGVFPPSAVINQWHYQGGTDYMEFVPTPDNPATEAATAGHDVVVSPFSHLYFDLGDPRNTALVYGLEPVPEGLSPSQVQHILGPHAPAWNQPQARADEMIFPRLTALAEVGWTDKSRRDWEGFVERSKTHYRRLTAYGLKFPMDWAVGGNGVVLGSWTPEKLTSSSVELEWDASANLKDAGRYEVIMLYQKGEHGIAINWIALIEDGKEIARDTHHGWSGYGKDNIVYTLELPARKPHSSYTIRAGIDCHLGTDSTGDILIRKQD